MKALFWRAARFATLDKAVGFALASRTWQLLAGPVTFLMIAWHFSPEMQGFYYTFSSLLALQSFVELGFSVVIINVASHEWSRLALDDKGCIIGDPEARSRIVSLGRLVFFWYAAASAIFVVLVSVIGWVFFGQATRHGVAWEAPWLALVAVTGVQLWVLPFTSLLEGCNQVMTVNQFRLAQSVCSGVVFWLSVYFGGGLWAAVSMAATRLTVDLCLLAVRYRKFFAPFMRPPTGARLDWSAEVWPMQWRLAMSGVVGYFAFSLYVPVMFHYHGAAVAGRLGMTMQVVGALQALSMVWISVRVPRYGVLIARRDYPGLDRLWFRTSTVSVALLATGASVIWMLVYAMDRLQLLLAQRVLEPWPTALFLLSAILVQIAQCQTAYMRAHKQEPIVALSVTVSLATAALVWILGRRLGAIGAAEASLVVAIVLVVWETAIWRRFRWQATASAASECA